MPVSQLRLWPSILCSTPSVFRAVHCRWIAPGRRFTLVQTTASLALQACLKEMSKMNRAIWRCWKVDGFLFDWPSFPHSSSRRHLLMIPFIDPNTWHPSYELASWNRRQKSLLILIRALQARFDSYPSQGLHLVYGSSVRGLAWAFVINYMVCSKVRRDSSPASGSLSF